MDPVRLGADVRLLRRHKGWTQARLAAEAGVSRWSVVQLEGGRSPSLDLDVVSRCAIALGGVLSVRVLFHGEGLDRLRDRDHAALVEQVVTRLRRLGWDVATEVSFNEWGERGSIDVLAFHRSTGSLLVVEVKTVVPDVGGMLMTIDRKVRLAARIAHDRGWDARTVSSLLVLAEGSTARRRIETHRATFETAFPVRGVAVDRWLRRPGGVLRGLRFLSSVRHADTKRSPAA
jgi:transcriptional regulator with XRE-family HTH domain